MKILLQKALAGGPGRKSRLHTEAGERIALLRALRDTPGCVATKLSTAFTGKRPDLPWWPVPVIAMVEARLKPHHTVIEYGSGGSTLWLAQRAASVCAIEDHAGWAAHVTGRLKAAGADHAAVLARDVDAYPGVPDTLGPIHLAVIDGNVRWRCFEAVLPKMAPGGTIYLDNADADKDATVYPQAGMVRVVQQRMEAVATERGARLIKVSGLAQGELAATEGWILDLPA